MSENHPAAQLQARRIPLGCHIEESPVVSLSDESREELGTKVPSCINSHEADVQMVGAGTPPPPPRCPAPTICTCCDRDYSYAISQPDR